MACFSGIFSVTQAGAFMNATLRFLKQSVLQFEALSWHTAACPQHSVGAPLGAWVQKRGSKSSRRRQDVIMLQVGHVLRHAFLIEQVASFNVRYDAHNGVLACTGHAADGPAQASDSQSRARDGPKSSGAIRGGCICSLPESGTICTGN